MHLFYYYDLVTSLEPDIKKQFDSIAGNRNNASVNIPVTAGQLIGRIGGQTLDFAVWNTEKQLTGFAEPAHYKNELWKIYTADPLDYMTPELKTFILSRYVRTEEPISGKIDWDIKGHLRGSWFREGTDYAGDSKDPEGYWKSQISFSPDLYDNSYFVISLGNYGSRGENNSQSAQQFFAKGNTPNPADVIPETGLVTYELVEGEYLTGTGARWDRLSLAHGITVNLQNNVVGTVLVQMIDDETLKLEIFPNKTADQVTGFNDNALNYTR